MAPSLDRLHRHGGVHHVEPVADSAGGPGREKGPMRKAAGTVVHVLQATSGKTRPGATGDRKDAELVNLVESNLERGDLAALVRYMFEGESRDGKQEKGTGAAARDAGAAAKNENLDAIKRALLQVMDHERSVISTWCSRNSTQMQAALDSVAHLQEKSESMRDDIVVRHTKLSGAGKKVVDTMAELQEAALVASYIDLAQQNVQVVSETVTKLAKAAKLVQKDDLHLALNILNDLRRENELLALHPLPAREKHPELADFSSGEFALLGIMANAVHTLEQSVRQQVRTTFHAWLAETRRLAKSIGERAVRRAAAEHAHEERLGQERRLLQSMLIKDRNFKKAKTLVLNFIASEDPQYGRSSIKQRSGAATAKPPDEQPDAPVVGVKTKRFKKQSMRAGRSVDQDESANALSLLEDVDMGDVHRCMHVHDLLGDLTAFKDYYFEQRRLQLLVDLVPPQSMMQSHRTYYAHIAGFFIMEESVLQSTGGLVTDSQIQSLWATAVSSMKAAMHSGFNETDSTVMMMVMKSYLVLIGSCLSQHNFDTTGLVASMLQYKDRYVDLLNIEVATNVKAVLRDELKPQQIETQEDLEEIVLGSGLPYSTDPSAGPPKPPFQAPFSRALPSMLTAIEGYIADTLQFLAGLMTPSELLSTIREARDKFLSRLLVDLYTAAMNRILHERNPLDRLVMMVADVHCLCQALKALDDYTIIVMRGSEENAEEDLLLVARANRHRARGGAGLLQGQAGGSVAGGGSAAAGGSVAGGSESVPAGTTQREQDIMADVRGSLDSFRAKLDITVLGLLRNEIEEHVKRALLQKWVSEEPMPDQVSPYMDGLVHMLSAFLSTARSTLPQATMQSFAKAAFAESSRAIKGFIADSGFKAWNSHGMQRLCLDVDSLLQVAYAYGQDMVLTPLDDVCTFLMKEEWHVAANIQHLKMSYPHIDPLLVATAMRKFEPTKLSYVERLRAGSGKQVTKGEIRGFANELEAAVSKGQF